MTRWRYTHRRGAEKWEDYWTPQPFAEYSDRRARTFVPSQNPGTRVWENGELRTVKA
jgi:hypothetical protein